MKPVILIITIVLQMHPDKTILYPGQGKCKKDRNTLSIWLAEIVKRIMDPDLGTVTEMIQNWNDEKNNAISFSF